MENKVEIQGTILQAFLSAGESLRLLLGKAANQIKTFEPYKWYPLEQFQILSGLLSPYKNFGCIIEQIGSEMMRNWYKNGPGKDIIFSSIDFLHYQSSSNGFRSVVQGPIELVGDFSLVEIDEPGGTAKINSTTVFPRDMERGVLKGGLGLIGDMLYYDVINTGHPDIFEIYFVTKQNRKTLSWHRGDIMEEIEWRFRHHMNQNSQKEDYWCVINETLNSAYEKMQDALSQLKVLTGLIPICASCKKIRDDTGYWNQLESYLRDHSEAEFTHSICPDCAKKLYPDLENV